MLAPLLCLLLTPPGTESCPSPSSLCPLASGICKLLNLLPLWGCPETETSIKTTPWFRVSHPQSGSSDAEGATCQPHVSDLCPLIQQVIIWVFLIHQLPLLNTTGNEDGVVGAVCIPIQSPGATNGLLTASRDRSVSLGRSPSLLAVCGIAGHRCGGQVLPQIPTLNCHCCKSQTPLQRRPPAGPSLR